MFSCHSAFLTRTKKPKQPSTAFNSWNKGGYGAVAIITQPDNPVGEVTLDQVRKIFLGEVTNWNQVGGLNEPIVPMTRDHVHFRYETFFPRIGP